MNVLHGCLLIFVLTLCLVVFRRHVGGSVGSIKGNLMLSCTAL